MNKYNLQLFAIADDIASEKKDLDDLGDSDIAGEVGKGAEQGVKDLEQEQKDSERKTAERYSGGDTVEEQLRNVQVGKNVNLLHQQSMKKIDEEMDKLVSIVTAIPTLERLEKLQTERGNQQAATSLALMKDQYKTNAELIAGNLDVLAMSLADSLAKAQAAYEREQAAAAARAAAEAEADNFSVALKNAMANQEEESEGTDVKEDPSSTSKERRDYRQEKRQQSRKEGQEKRSGGGRYGNQGSVKMQSGQKGRGGGR